MKLLLPVGSIQRVCHDTLPWLISFSLGVGLHSYGFMQKAFPWLVAFMISQLALMSIAAMPLERWRSFPAVTTSLPAKQRGKASAPASISVARQSG